jgi:uncharacterized protein (TIGR03089 family)
MTASIGRPYRDAVTASTIPELLKALLGSDPARPLLTFYDDATGERIELSVTSFDNWVAKTANLLRDGLGIEPEDDVAILLPTHWLGCVWLCAAWACGLRVSLGPDRSADAALVVRGPGQLDGAGTDATLTVAVSLRPLGAAFSGPLPAGVTDYTAEVLGYGDRFTADLPEGPETPALLTAHGSLSQRELLDRALAAAGRVGLGPGGRLLTDANPASEQGLCWLLAPLVVRGSLVLVRHLDPQQTPARVSQERVSVRLLSR